MSPPCVPYSMRHNNTFIVIQKVATTKNKRRAFMPGSRRQDDQLPNVQFLGVYARVGLLHGIEADAMFARDGGHGFATGYNMGMRFCRMRCRGCPSGKRQWSR